MRLDWVSTLDSLERGSQSKPSFKFFEERKFERQVGEWSPFCRNPCALPWADRVVPVASTRNASTAGLELSDSSSRAAPARSERRARARAAGGRSGPPSRQSGLTTMVSGTPITCRPAA